MINFEAKKSAIIDLSWAIAQTRALVNGKCVCRRFDGFTKVHSWTCCTRDWSQQHRQQQHQQRRHTAKTNRKGERRQFVRDGKGKSWFAAKCKQRSVYRLSKSNQRLCKHGRSNIIGGWLFGVCHCLTHKFGFTRLCALCK